MEGKTRCDWWSGAPSSCPTWTEWLTDWLVFTRSHFALKPSGIVGGKSPSPVHLSLFPVARWTIQPARITQTGLGCIKAPLTQTKTTLAWKFQTQLCVLSHLDIVCVWRVPDMCVYVCGRLGSNYMCLARSTDHGLEELKLKLRSDWKEAKNENKSSKKKKTRGLFWILLENFSYAFHWKWFLVLRDCKKRLDVTKFWRNVKEKKND